MRTAVEEVQDVRRNALPVGAPQARFGVSTLPRRQLQIQGKLGMEEMHLARPWDALLQQSKKQVGAFQVFRSLVLLEPVGSSDFFFLFVVWSFYQR
jgi:hypothetical protein